LLLELFRRKGKKITAAELLREFEKNRFAAPSIVTSVDFKELELRISGWPQPKILDWLLYHP
jgi:hypothetical protein